MSQVFISAYNRFRPSSSAFVVPVVVVVVAVVVLRFSGKRDGILKIYSYGGV